MSTWGPGPFEEHHQLELSWYAIHPIEMLFTIMGPGCETVTRMAGRERGRDHVPVEGRPARVGADAAAVRRLRRGDHAGAAVGGDPTAASTDYRPLVVEIIKFFQTGKPPVSTEETLEIFAFMDAAQRSKEQGGRPVKLR